MIEAAKPARPILAVVGGTGTLGTGLVARWARAGYRVVVGSRSREKADRAARRFADHGPSGVSGMDNRSAAEAADIVVLAVPYACHSSILRSIREVVQGKIVVDTTVPLAPQRVTRVQLPPEGSAAMAAQEFLGERVRVVAAFHNVAAARLKDIDADVDCDVLVCGNDPKARTTVLELVRAAGLRGWHAGSIDNSLVPEALTSVLLFLNRRYKTDGSGIRITGLPIGDSESAPVNAT